MKSRWTDFLTTEGEKEWRVRGKEFELVIDSRKEFITKWDDGWNCLFNALKEVNPSNINQEVLIRDQKHNVAEVINRQVMHYAYHIGQIVHIGRMVKGKSWKSLSVLKGKSKEYNNKVFGKGSL